MLKIINNYLEGLRPRGCLLVALVGTLVLGVLDYLIGPELSFSVFCTAPIMLAGWYGGKRAGLAAGSHYAVLLMPLWNTLVRPAFFLIILWLLLLLLVREKPSLEESLTDTDSLTGLANRRFFLEQLEREYACVGRYPEPFTIAYFDLDNFKYVNDSPGHDVGDRLLLFVAHT